jgi:hypothetical protein
MSLYAVKRNLPGITMTELGQAQNLAIKVCKRVTDEGLPVKYIRSNYFPSNSTCICIFEANETSVVKKVNDEAPIPYDEITEVLDLPSP